MKQSKQITIAIYASVIALGLLISATLLFLYVFKEPENVYPGYQAPSEKSWQVHQLNEPFTLEGIPQVSKSGERLPVEMMLGYIGKLEYEFKSAQLYNDIPNDAGLGEYLAEYPLTLYNFKNPKIVAVTYTLKNIDVKVPDHVVESYGHECINVANYTLVDISNDAYKSSSISDALYISSPATIKSSENVPNTNGLVWAKQGETIELTNYYVVDASIVTQADFALDLTPTGSYNDLILVELGQPIETD